MGVVGGVLIVLHTNNNDNDNNNSDGDLFLGGSTCVPPFSFQSVLKKKICNTLIIFHG